MPFTKREIIISKATPDGQIWDSSPSEPGGSCTIVTRVNGELRQDYDIEQERQSDPPAMIFGHEELLETIEKSMKLEPCGGLPRAHRVSARAKTKRQVVKTWRLGRSKSWRHRRSREFRVRV